MIVMKMIEVYIARSKYSLLANNILFLVVSLILLLRLPFYYLVTIFVVRILRLEAFVVILCGFFYFGIYIFFSSSLLS
jgi:hypothetical protein